MRRGLLCAASAALILFFGTAASARADDDACWQLIYHAIERSAAAPHAAYISYAERVHIVADGRRFEEAHATITYRDDGIASVNDDRWAHPFMSALLDPGPPVLGPYGSDRRSAWLALTQSGGALPVIGTTSTQPRERCVDRGDESLDGASVAHLVLPDAATAAPALKAIWVDRRTYDVKRIVVSEWLSFYGQTSALQHKLVDFTLDLERAGSYDVIRRVTWTHYYHEFGQVTALNAEYRFSDYRFAEQPPAGTLFATLPGHRR